MSRSIAWYVNRLRSMEPAEIAHRVREKARKWQTRRSLPSLGYAGDRGPPPTLPGLDKNLAAAGDDIRNAIAAESDRLRQGHFSALGRDWPKRAPDDLFPSEVWRLDPVTGQTWPGSEAFCFDISYRHERDLGDVKYVWELNKLQFLQPLAADFALNGDRESLAAVEAAIESWARANPPFRGIAWADTMTTAVRGMSLLIASSFCGAALSPATVERLRGLLRVHAQYAERFPSLHSSANNHLVGELVAACLIGVALDPATTIWSVPAWGRLMDELTKQILADGIGAEQSPSYAAFIAECGLVVGTVARAQGRDLPEAVRDRLARFAEAIFWMSTPDGLVPEIGDNDEGTVLALRPPERRYPMSVARAVYGYLGMQTPGAFPLPPTLRDLVLPGKGGAAALSGLRDFRHGGLTVVRDEADGTSYVLTLDHGPLGYLSIAAHGHADALAITLVVDGEPILVDPGTYLYHSGGAWRDWFRGTPAHSTLNIAGRNQSTIAGTFNWSRKAHARVHELIPGDDWRVRASHDGYVKPYGLTHERTVARRAGGFALLDRLLGASDPPSAEIVFQLAAGLSAERNGGEVVVARGERRIARIAFSIPGDVAIADGGEIGEGGWVSESFGTKVPAVRIAWRGKLPPNGLETSIVLGAGAQTGPN